jgi:hypothetical protein
LKKLSKSNATKKKKTRIGRACLQEGEQPQAPDRLWLLVLVSTPLKIHTRYNHSYQAYKCPFAKKKKSHCHIYMCGSILDIFFFLGGGEAKREREHKRYKKEEGYVK